jgi:hypothetical protein
VISLLQGAGTRRPFAGRTSRVRRSACRETTRRAALGRLTRLREASAADVARHELPAPVIDVDQQGTNNALPTFLFSQEADSLPPELIFLCDATGRNRLKRRREPFGGAASCNCRSP